MRVFMKPNEDNNCMACWERCNVLMHDAGLPILDELSWEAGRWIDEALFVQTFCPHETGEGGVLLETEP